ncbi:Txe/YoeB family addiction module toxin [Hymenobacter fastidiosus]|uniref:Putative mRNA interferase YoeB n=1 Tax=Hymenobacter fastidiosus TaxID=486264 RepID=A0ABP7S1M2_9BACT
MTLSGDTAAWEGFQYWLDTAKAVARKIRALLTECLRTPTTGTGQPEALKHDYAGYWSRRISDEHRLVYRFEANLLHIIQCRYHYAQ